VNSESVQKLGALCLISFLTQRFFTTKGSMGARSCTKDFVSREGREEGATGIRR